MKFPKIRFKTSLDIAGFDLYFSAGNDSEAEREPQQQGSTSGDLSLAPHWDHDTREPVARIGFTAKESP
ncbi:hypothetical protein [Kineosporia babensis]|uniref:Uncharacterized protein n=1 Tax=Kineosporia babensis TaxID=499548 RepID=A0A9X1SSP8_9ACTN|nr:hypothetical protein [Kineosporia babensis]MCD5310809.1 hypothetical protein [Kineosporia babensis]